FLRGIPAGRAEVLDIQPGVIPGTIPAADQWDETGFNIRRFEPPRLGPGFAADDVPDAVVKIVDVFKAARTGDESFMDTYRRIGVEPFKEALYDAH
ncbi:MAG: hypothetical protein K2P80_06020, partial [Beijerinckiaceae bacterium]|nr:hypothetical protein [Beijerinckiaceae bacterium]